MNSNYKLKQDQEVTFDYPGVGFGEGKIVGCGLVDMPWLGKHYLVKVTCSDIDYTVYPFNTIMIPELFINKE